MIGGVALEWWQLLLSTILPVLTGLITARVAHSGMKATILAALAALTELARQVVDLSVGGSEVQIVEIFPNTVSVFVIAVAMHYGFWKPVKVTGREGLVPLAVPGGVGGGGPAGRHGWIT